VEEGAPPVRAGQVVVGFAEAHLEVEVLRLQFDGLAEGFEHLSLEGVFSEDAAFDEFGSEIVD